MRAPLTKTHTAFCLAALALCVGELMNSLDEFHLQSKPPNNRTTPIADIAARLRAQLASPQPAIEALSTGDCESVPVAADEIVAADAADKNACQPEQLIQIWPTIARLAIASGEGPYFRLWALLSEYSRRDGGRGSFRLNSESLKGLACTLGITPSTLSTIVRKGDGIYWSRGGNRLWQVSAVKLYEHLQGAAQLAAIAGYDEPNRRKMLIPIESFSSLELFYATCLNAWLMDRKAGEFMVTWNVLAAWWGRNRACLNRWMKIAGIERTANEGNLWVANAGDQRHFFDVIHDHPTGQPNCLFIKDGQIWRWYQRGNTYYANQSVSRARRGAFKLLNASSGNSSGASTQPDAEQWQRHNLKANFRAVDAHSRYQKKHGLPDISYTLSAREVITHPRIRGRQVWRAWEPNIATRK